MAIMAHPDDSEFGIAGTVARWVKEGWQVYYVIVADGAGGGPDDATEVGPAARRKTVEMREQEQIAAAKVLGVSEVIFLGYPDGQVLPTIELRRDLVRVLRQYRPLRVICPSPERSWTPSLRLPVYHPDHLATGQAALAAIYPMAQNPWDFPELLEEGLKPHKVCEVYITAAPVLNHAIDISDTIELKMTALKAHTSQVGAEYEQVNQFLRQMNAERGQKYGMGYAEEYHYVQNQMLPD